MIEHEAIGQNESEKEVYWQTPELMLQNDYEAISGSQEDHFPFFAFSDEDEDDLGDEDDFEVEDDDDDFEDDEDDDFEDDDFDDDEDDDDYKDEDEDDFDEEDEDQDFDDLD